MHNTPHPGELIRRDVIDGLCISVAEAARRLDISRGTLTRVLSGDCPVSPELALRLELAGAGTARAWLMMQLSYDLEAAQLRFRPPIGKLTSSALHQTDSELMSD